MTTQRKLPPTERDFEIYHSIQITGSTTRRVAEQNDLSQTRVRQIVARVVQWIAEVLPREADITREKRALLARHIAADRLQYQYEEAAELWSKTSATKYMGLLTRLTLATARLGVVSGTIDGLAADALEGLPMNEWAAVGGAADHGDSNDRPPPEDCSEIDGVGGVADHREPSATSQSRPLLKPGTAEFLNSFRNIWPPSERIRLAVELEEALQFLPSEHREAIRAYELEKHPASQLALEAAVRDGLIPADEAYLIDPASYPPPIEDCSTKAEYPDAATEPLDESQDRSSSYDKPTATESDQIAPSSPLLTYSRPQPATELRITPEQPGVEIMSPASAPPEHQTLASLPITLPSS